MFAASETEFLEGATAWRFCRGTAVVEHVNSEWIQAVVLNKCTLRIARNCDRWDRQYMRWETSAHTCVETDEKATAK